MTRKQKVQQDFEMSTQLVQSFYNRTGKQNGTPKGEDKTHPG